MLDKFSLVLDNAEDVFFFDNQVFVVVDVDLGSGVCVEKTDVTDLDLLHF
jgi:hypothetical protein